MADDLLDFFSSAPLPSTERAEEPARVRVVLADVPGADDGGRCFEVSFPYDPAMVEQCRSIPGRRWVGPSKTNRIPVSAKAALALRAFLDSNGPVAIADDASELLASLVVAAGDVVVVPPDELAELSRAADADFEVDGLGGELRSFQKAGVAYALRAQGRAFIADDMGTGKTVQALAAVLAADAFPAIVVCPASVKLSWRDHVRGPAIGAPKGWLPGRKVVVLTGTTPDAETLAGADVIVANWDIIAPPAAPKETRDGEPVESKSRRGPGWLDALIAIGPRAVIFDESHYAKTRKAGRTKAALALGKSIPADGLILNLTGTAVLNRPIELTAQLELIGRLDDFGGFMRFAKRYCGAFKDTHGWNFDGATNLPELNERLRGTCFIRRMKSEVMSELPEKQIARVPVSIDNLREYAAAEQNVIAWLVSQVEGDADFAAEIADLDDSDRETAIRTRKSEVAKTAASAERLVQINALRRIVARGKIAGTIEWVSNFLDSTDEKLVLFASHVDDAQKPLLAAFPGAAHVFGEDSVEARSENVARFQNDPACRLIVCSLQAAGIGITLTAASNVAFVELGWTPAIHDQAEDRAHRMGQKGSVTCWYLLADSTIDEDMYELIEAKRAVVSAATDGTVSVRSDSILGDLEARLMARAGR